MPIPKNYHKSQLRPSSVRARTVMFDLLIHGALGDVVSNARVLDLFAGTGALGLEALSRGAATVVFVENWLPARQLINRNIHHMSLQSQTAIRSFDASCFGKNFGDPFSLMFLDPPYVSGLADSSVQSALAGRWIVHGSVVVIEAPEPVEICDSLDLVVDRRVGLAWIGVFEFSQNLR